MKFFFEQRRVVFRKLLILLFYFAFFMISTRAECVPENPVEGRWIPRGEGVLTVGASFEHKGIERESGQFDAQWVSGVRVGLGWRSSLPWMVRAGFMIGGLWALGEEMRYRAKNREMSVEGGFIFGIFSDFEVYLYSTVVGLLITAQAQMLTVKERSGLFDFDVGIGLSARPFVNRRSVLQSVDFAVLFLFPIYSDDEKAMDIRYRNYALGMRVMCDF